MLSSVQNAIITSVLRNDNLNDIVKVMVLSYLFYQLCWDFNYNILCSDIVSGVFDYISYDFEDIQNPCLVGDKTDIPKCPDIGFKFSKSLKEVN